MTIRTNILKAEKHEVLDEWQSSLLSVILYFDLFRHPLKADEIHSMAHFCSPDLEMVLHTLKKWEEERLIFRYRDYYSVREEVADMATRREQGALMASRYTRKAKRISAFIGWFPFVRGVFISGSLSKGYMDSGSDIDYFIVTEKERLWICRSFLALFRKVTRPLLGRYFCINYFISTDRLEIPDKNIFTATELLFIMPSYSTGMYMELLQANNWIWNYFPNKKGRLDMAAKPGGKTPFFTSAFEFVLNKTAGNKLDEMLFRFMSHRWEKKKQNRTPENDVNFRTLKHAAKQHEKGHQWKILSAFENRVQEFESTNQVKLTLHG